LRAKFVLPLWRVATSYSKRDLRKALAVNRPIHARLLHQHGGLSFDMVKDDAITL